MKITALSNLKVAVIPYEAYAIERDRVQKKRFDKKTEFFNSISVF